MQKCNTEIKYKEKIEKEITKRKYKEKIQTTQRENTEREYREK